MKTHQEIDQRSLALARAVVEKLESGDPVQGISRARENCLRWQEKHALSVHDEWLEILNRSWGEIKSILLDESEDATRLRQSTPFCGILTPQERWSIYREWRSHEAL